MVCDDSRKTVLMMPPSLSCYSLEGDWGRDEKVGKYCGNGLLGYGNDNDEVRVSVVSKEGN